MVVDTASRKTGFRPTALRLEAPTMDRQRSRHTAVCYQPNTGSRIKSRLLIRWKHGWHSTRTSFILALFPAYLTYRPGESVRGVYLILRLAFFEASIGQHDKEQPTFRAHYSLLDSLSWPSKALVGLCFLNKNLVRVPKKELVEEFRRCHRHFWTLDRRTVRICIKCLDGLLISSFSHLYVKLLAPLIFNVYRYWQFFNFTRYRNPKLIYKLPIYRAAFLWAGVV